MAKNIDKALETQLYVIQELGPLAFILKEEGLHERKFRVALGQLHKCNCPYHLTHTELCHHILWVLLKVLKVPRDNEYLYQKSLLDREVTEILRFVRQSVTLLTFRSFC